MYTVRIKRALPLVLSLAAALLLTACGNRQAPADVPDAPAEPPAQYSSQEPFAAYLDLSKLSQETLDACTQVIDQTSTDNGVTVHVNQVLGDAMTMYVAFEVTYPDSIDVNDPTTYVVQDHTPRGSMEARLVSPEEPDTSSLGPGVSLNGSHTDSHTLSYIGCFTYQEEYLTKEKEVTLVLVDGTIGNSYHEFSWTVDFQADFQHTDLKDSDGQVVGSAVLSPFALNFSLNTPAEEGNTLIETITLLNDDGQHIEVGCSPNINAGNQIFSAEFFIPVEVDTVKTIQAGPYTGTF